MLCSRDIIIVRKNAHNVAQKDMLTVDVVLLLVFLDELVQEVELSQLIGLILEREGGGRGGEGRGGEGRGGEGRGGEGRGGEGRGGEGRGGEGKGGKEVREDTGREIGSHTDLQVCPQLLNSELSHILCTADMTHIITKSLF